MKWKIVFPQMKTILGMMMLLLIVASVAADSSTNSTIQQDGTLASSVGQNQPNQVAAECYPFCLPGMGRKREAQSGERLPDTQTRKRFQPQSLWFIAEQKDSTLSTVPRLLARKREAFERQQRRQAQGLWQDNESVTSYKRGGSIKPLRARLI